MLSELHWCQAQAGTVHNLLTRPEIPIDYIETCWIMSIRDFLCTYKLHINIAEHIIIPTTMRRRRLHHGCTTPQQR